MTKLLTSKLGRLRIIGFLEGVSLLILIFIAMPMKYYFQNPVGSQVMGPVHGGLFLLFVINTLGVGVERNWMFRSTTWKVLLACMLPFGTFYIDRQIFRKEQESSNE